MTSQMKSLVLEISATNRLHLCEMQILREPLTMSCSGSLIVFNNDAPIFRLTADSCANRDIGI